MYHLIITLCRTSFHVLMINCCIVLHLLFCIIIRPLLYFHLLPLSFECLLEFINYLGASLVKYKERNITPPAPLFFSSLMDREVTLMGEMDKVKAEASKYFVFFLL